MLIEPPRRTPSLDTVPTAPVAHRPFRASRRRAVRPRSRHKVLATAYDSVRHARRTASTFHIGEGCMPEFGSARLCAPEQRGPLGPVTRRVSLLACSRRGRG